MLYVHFFFRRNDSFLDRITKDRFSLCYCLILRPKSISFSPSCFRWSYYIYFYLLFQIIPTIPKSPQAMKIMFCTVISNVQTIIINNYKIIETYYNWINCSIISTRWYDKINWNSLLDLHIYSKWYYNILLIISSQPYIIYNLNQIL